MVVKSRKVGVNRTKSVKKSKAKPPKQSTRRASASGKSAGIDSVLRKCKVRERKAHRFLGSLIAYKYTFANGLKVIFVPRRIAPVFSYQTWYDVGARDEDENYTGMAHFFEHLMFKRIKGRKPGEFDQIMESSGARDLNAFTSSDYTAYVQSLPVESFSTVAHLESQRMTNLLLSKSEVDSEREVVHNERKERSENSPEGVMFDRLLARAFEKHPYRCPVIGYKEDLDRMTIKELQAFYGTYYVPNNATIVIAGDLTEEVVLKTIHKFYGKIDAADIPQKNIPQEPPQTEERRETLELDLQVPKIYVGYKIPPAGARDVLLLGLFCSILSSGRSSYLYRGLIDKGVAIEANAATGESKDSALLYIVGTAQSGKTGLDLLNAIDATLEQIFAKGVSKEELSRAMNKTKVEFYQAFKTNSSIANFIGHSEVLYKDFLFEVKEFAELDQITAKEILDCAQKYLQPKHRTIIIGSPRGA